MKHTWHDLPRPFFILAPMEAVTDVVFRHVVKQAAAPDLFFTEFTNATGWVHAGEKAIRGRLIKTNDEHPIIAQIWGGEVGDMAQLATYCRDLGYDGIDINMGCPAKSAVKSGGSALIRNPQLAAEAIAAAKTAGLPVSVKTRLGYTHIDEWRDWLTHLFSQDIVNLTIHLRTKKEMSKVPAHFELIPAIVALRDEIAPQTLITINGDIRDRAHGEELARQYGVDGVMIGRGIFHDPFAFARTTLINSSAINPIAFSATKSPETASLHVSARASAPRETWAADASVDLLPSGSTAVSPADYLSLPFEGNGASIPVEPLATLSKETSAARVSPAAYARETRHEAVSEDNGGEEANGGRDSEEANEIEDKQTRQVTLLNLLNYHLDLYDQWQPQLGRPFETLKRFFKIYVRDFPGASELREQLMHTTNTDEVRELIKKAAP